jgi:hypothetical protein
MTRRQPIPQRRSAHRIDADMDAMVGAMGVGGGIPAELVAHQQMMMEMLLQRLPNPPSAK